LKSFDLFIDKASPRKNKNGIELALFQGKGNQQLISGFPNIILRKRRDYVETEGKLLETNT